MNVYNAEEETAAPNGAGRYGADLSWLTSEAAPFVVGVYTVTAP